MKTIAYLDCPTGIAGDMCLAALIDAGVPLAYLQEQLSSLGLDDEFTLTVEPVRHQGLRGLHATVALAEAHSADDSHPHSPGHAHPPARHLPEIERLIAAAALSDRVRAQSLAIFRRLGEAEAAVHGIALDQVHFHEVGATDALVDIVGTCLGLDYLGVERLVCSPLPVGQGRVRAAHGWLPVPAPAVLKLCELGRVPLYSNGLTGELVTPTGAAIATVLAASFGPPPAMTLHRTGLGAGTKALPVPNLLRLWVGHAEHEEPRADVQATPESAAIAPTPHSPLPHSPLPHSPLPHSPLPHSPLPHSPTPYPTEPVVVLETQVDDLLPQAVGYLYDRLFAAGALDVFAQPVTMKKSRPGLVITTICRPAAEARCLDILFAETSTLGIRRQPQQRWVLDRRVATVQTPYGAVAVKLAHHPTTQARLNVHPEYEDCAALARHHGLPWQTIYDSALSSALAGDLAGDLPGDLAGDRSKTPGNAHPDGHPSGHPDGHSHPTFPPP